jgi:hypothetical protein
MNRRKTVAWLGWAAWTVLGASAVAAHEGHDHKLIGTVAAVEGTTLHVEQQDHSHVTVVLTETTKYLRGKKSAKAADLVKGQRVAVTYRDEAGRKVAREVLLGVQAGENSEKAKTQAPPHHH